ncbi:MAG: T9SS type A sorting domain-containing protein, partial [Chitinophagales bacterium]|nr:T9SS type A sorting domain-containing protein [Chitinophagales bacterium]
EERITDYEESGILGVTPQFENEPGNYILEAGGWIKAEGFYFAQGGEKWITIGNFKPDEETDKWNIPGFYFEDGLEFIYFFIDDVKVLHFPEMFLPDTTVCGGTTLNWYVNLGEGDYLWSTGDTTKYTDITESGIYWLQFTGNEYTFTDSAEVFFTPDTTFTSITYDTICFHELPLAMSASFDYADVTWSTGDTGYFSSLPAGGVQWAKGYIGCNLFVDTFYIEVIPDTGGIINDFEIADTLICSDAEWELSFTGPDNYDTYNWSTGDTTQTVILFEPGLYSVSYSIQCYEFIEYFRITTDAYMNETINLGDDLNLCSFPNETIVLDAGELPNYLWSTGNLKRQQTITEPGKYWVTSTTPCHTIFSDTIEITTCHIPLELQIFPTVSFGQIWIQSNHTETIKDLHLEIFSVQGKIYETAFDLYGKQPLDFRSFMKGYYLIKARVGSDIFWFKIILQ